MNLFKKDPFHIFQIVAAIITAVLVTYSALYFARHNIRDFMNKNLPETQIIDQKDKQVFVDYSQFGVIHVGLDSPSYAQSNFDVSPKTPIILYINGRVEEGDLVDKFSLTNSFSGEIVPITVTIVDRKQESSSKHASLWEQSWVQKAMFKPVNPLESASKYEIKVASGLRSEDDQYSSSLDFVYAFTTVDEPGIQSTNVADGNPLSEDDNIIVMFKSPMDTADLKNKVSLEPSDVEFKILNNDKVLIIENVFTKNTNYTLKIPADTKDIYGRELGENVELKFNYR